MQRIPARVGDAVEAIDTPALVVDLDAFERNLDRMADARAARHRAPAARQGHKCPDIARRQIGAGRSASAARRSARPRRSSLPASATCWSPTRSSARRRSRGSRRSQARRRSACWSTMLRTSASRRRGAGRGLDARRAGRDRRRHAALRRRAGRAAAALAQIVARTPALRFRGIHAYHGGAQHLRAPAGARDAIANAVRLARETKAAIEAAGIKCPVVTGAGTGTWQHERDSGIYTEVQPGSYIFMDADYHRNALAPASIISSRACTCSPR